MQDALLSLSKALPAAGASLATDGLDLSIVSPNSSAWRDGYFLVSVPALTAHTDSSKIILLDLQVAPFKTVAAGAPAPNFPPTAGTYANSSPFIECKIPGVASTGSLATTFKVPLPPGTQGWVRFNATVPSGDGAMTTSTITYTWTIGETE